jgi:hypothetical protein
MVLGDTLMFLYNISDWTYKCCCRYTQWLLTIIYFAVGYPINCHKLIVIVLKCCWTLPPFLWTRYLPIHYHILLLDTQYIFIFKKNMTTLSSMEEFVMYIYIHIIIHLPLSSHPIQADAVLRVWLGLGRQHTRATGSVERIQANGPNRWTLTGAPVGNGYVTIG